MNIIQNFIDEMQNKGFKVSVDHEINMTSVNGTIIIELSRSLKPFILMKEESKVYYIFPGIIQCRIKTSKKRKLENEYLNHAYEHMEDSSIFDILLENADKRKIEYNNMLIKEARKDYEELINKFENSFSRYSINNDKNISETDTFLFEIHHRCLFKGIDEHYKIYENFLFGNKIELDYGVKLFDCNCKNNDVLYNDRNSLVITCKNKHDAEFKISINNIIVMTKNLSIEIENELHNCQMLRSIKIDCMNKEDGLNEY